VRYSPSAAGGGSPPTVADVAGGNATPSGEAEATAEAETVAMKPEVESPAAPEAPAVLDAAPETSAPPEPLPSPTSNKAAPNGAAAGGSAASSDPFDSVGESPTADEAAPSEPAVEPAADPVPAEPAPVSATEQVKTATAHETLLAWRLASKWTLAAEVYAKGLDGTRYEPLRDEAAAAAAELGLDLPEWPAADDSSKLESVVIQSLREGAGSKLDESIAEAWGPRAGAVARLASVSHLLLLVYTPQDPQAESYAADLRTAGEASGLPAELWQPLTDLVDKRAEFLEVRSAVFELHRRVEGHLGGL
jgi:hypothetical protein